VEMYREPAREIPVAAETEVLVVGGGSAGVTAATAAARNGAETLLLERYGYLGGDATGSMVIVLDDMTDGKQITVGGLAQETIDRLDAIGAAVYPPEEDRWVASAKSWAKWKNWGFQDLYSRVKVPKPIVYSVSFDPDAFKMVSLDMLAEAKVKLRLHSWVVGTIVEDGTIRGVIVESKAGRHAIRARIVIDASGDGDVFASAGAKFTHDGYMLTVVHRMGNVDTDEWERFELEHPDEAKKHNAAMRKIYGGSWDEWWLKTVRDGVVWCNCPHFNGLDGLKVEDLTFVEVDGRRRIREALAYARANLAGWKNAYIIDTGSQIGIRQTRLLQGEHVMTKEDVFGKRRFEDTIGRGRDYYMPYRSLLPVGVENLLVAGRHFSATPEAQRASREIPPCQAMGQAAGTAAAMALRDKTSPRKVDVRRLQETLVKQGQILETKSNPAGDFLSGAAAKPAAPVVRPDDALPEHARTALVDRRSGGVAERVVD
jgi:2-polyprenyl-6-methoxyphenol hydroxylase-like FAD-dependent oxidoreductase